MGCRRCWAKFARHFHTRMDATDSLRCIDCFHVGCCSELALHLHLVESFFHVPSWCSYDAMTQESQPALFFVRAADVFDDGGASK